MGRPRETQPDPMSDNAVHLNSRVSVADGEMIRAMAAARSMSMSQLVRDLIIPVAQAYHREALAQDEATP